MGLLSVLVVDDSSVYRKIITMAVSQTGVAAVRADADSAQGALDQLVRQRFDVVLLDVNMPGRDGISVLPEMKRLYPATHVVMISSLGLAAAELTMKALQLGAVDFIVKPLDESFAKNMEIVGEHLKRLFVQWVAGRPLPSERAVKELGEKGAGGRHSSDLGSRGATAEADAHAQEPKPRSAHPPASVPARPASRRRFDFVVIAASTGGPAALEQLLPALPGALSVPLMIVQHMPRDFTHVLAQSLAHRSGLDVREARQGEALQPGRVYVAPGGVHLAVRRLGAGGGPPNTGHQTLGHSSASIPSDVPMLELLDTEPVHGVRPAADVLLQSIAREFPESRTLVVVLTGMGLDGTQGVGTLRAQADCYCIAQDEASSVVYGMPRAIAEAGYADEVLPLADIAKQIHERVRFGVSERAY